MRRLPAALLTLLLAGPAPAAGPADLPPDVFPPGSDAAKVLPRMLADQQRERVREASRRESDAFRELKTQAGWEAFRDARVAALRKSLGDRAGEPAEAKPTVFRTLDGDGYHVDCVTYESGGVLVTANLYRPAKPPASMPVFLLSHSHHAPKTEGELQDIGATRARAGCLVLVPDHPGHGERRQHPFRTKDDFPGPFRVGRQDYYFRHALGVQLSLAGDSYPGRQVADLARGLDVLLATPGADPKRVIVVGAVAGGGDPAGVLAALDPRVTAVVPFNFGGPQPDYTTPEDTDRDFYWFGQPYWEPSRCLRGGAHGGFAQWVIVAAAPRKLGYAHEFARDEAKDPAWPRLKRVYDWYGAGDGLRVIAGQGNLKGQPPESSHCNNVGPLHCSRLDPVLKDWFGLPVPAEFSARRPAADLACLPADATPKLLHAAAGERADALVAAYRKALADLTPDERRARLRKDWAALLGGVTPATAPKAKAVRTTDAEFGTAEYLAVETEPGITVPALLLLPPKGKEKPAVVVAVAQQGKAAFLKEAGGTVAELLKGGVAVCLPDVRGTGETRPGDGRGRGSEATTRAAAEEMLGGTLVGGRLRDLRAVLGYLRTRDDLRGDHVALWGDSFAPTNPDDPKVLNVPADAEKQPTPAEPTGGVLALLGGLFDDGVRGVYVRRGLDGYRSALDAPLVCVPQDATVPGALTAGDLADLAAALAPRPLRLERLVDGRNRPVPAAAMLKALAPATAAYAKAKAADRLELADDKAGGDAAGWLLRALRP